jgi:hypothetical protein
MYMQEGGTESKSFSQAPYLYVAVAMTVAGTLYLGILPAPALEWTRVSFFSLD